MFYISVTTGRLNTCCPLSGKLDLFSWWYCRLFTEFHILPLPKDYLCAPKEKPLWFGNNFWHLIINNINERKYFTPYVVVLSLAVWVLYMIVHNHDLWCHWVIDTIGATKISCNGPMVGIVLDQIKLVSIIHLKHIEGKLLIIVVGFFYTNQDIYFVCLIQFGY